jgi:serine/threonine protein kinase
MSAEASPSRSEHASALAPGTRLNEFELQQILGVGGFGIVYQAFDHALEREVAIKEYMPASLAGRTETMRVSLRSGSDEESFRIGRESFVKEAKLLARFDHPSLLKVYRYWEANGTAYMAMPILRGRTLKQLRLAQQGPTDEAWLRRLLMPLLGAIETLHRENVFHRDIAPDNIQVEPDGHPVLMDFGAARRVLTDKTQSLTAILKPAYAPIEQYGEAGAVKQGPWTDLYALGATLHYMLLGRPPAPATARTVDDEEMLLTTSNLPQCSQGFLLAIQWMLRPRPGDRPQSVAQLREVFEGRAAVPVNGGIAELRAQLYARPDGQRPHDHSGEFDPSELPTLLSPTRPAPDATELLRTNPGASLPPADATVRVPPPAPPRRADSAASPDAAAAAPAARKSPLPRVIAGLAVVGVATAVFWPKSEPATAGPQPAAAVPATVATPVAPPVVGAGPAAATPPPAGAAPEPAAITVPPVGKPVEAATEQPPAAAAAPAPIKPSSKSNPPAPVAPSPTRAAENAPPPKPPASPAAEPVPVGPGAACGARSDGVRYLVCMERECATSAFSSHPACAAIRQ